MSEFDAIELGFRAAATLHQENRGLARQRTATSHDASIGDGCMALGLHRRKGDEHDMGHSAVAGGRVTMTSRDPVNAALRPSVLPSLRTLERKLDEVAQIVRGIEHDTLVELWRRAEQASEADGYPSSSMGPGIRSSGDSSTETAALADDVADEVIAALAEAAAEVSEAHGLMRRVDRRLVFAKARGESHRGRMAEGADCACCGEFVSGAPSDRIRAGYCPACWTAWGRFRAGRSEDQGTLRREFILERRAEIARQKAEGA